MAGLHNEMLFSRDETLIVGQLLAKRNSSLEPKKENYKTCVKNEKSI